MTKFEQLSLRAHRAELEMLRSLMHAAGCYHNNAAHDVEIAIEHHLVAGAVDDRDETHG